MSNTEARPAAVMCRRGPGTGAAAVEVLEPRSVPLGGVRAMPVRRTLPQRTRSLIGAWCFVDHYGPDDVAVTGGMRVPPHPHTGLQTVSWLFSGELEHRDSLGTVAPVRPGQLNLMTAGHGICHSELSTPDTSVLHGVQLWIALPDAHRDTPGDFQHYEPEPVDLGGVTVRVFLGSLGGRRAPVPTFTPLLGAELTLPPSARLTLDLDPAFEHGVLADTGEVDVAGTPCSGGQLGYLEPGVEQLTLVNPGPEPGRVILLGGTPLGEDLVMWWNFVGRSHEEIARFRDEWQAGSERFGQVDGYPGDRLPAPDLPATRLVPRRDQRHR
ncbi:pirin family protein [Actinophytocola sp.]|uniref:pirin family protein n=1 Tax=Actinophytocola sp. TaxID=1872138 RepID=UPI002D7E92A6|nr:pirin family protein [Actinophytocola sp.]HET9138325.1 pirin family protein [Actinophytocola sp.]